MFSPINQYHLPTPLSICKHLSRSRNHIRFRLKSRPPLLHWSRNGESGRASRSRQAHTGQAASMNSFDERIGIREEHVHGRRWSSTWTQTSKSCANLSIELHALHMKMFPFSQMSVFRPNSLFPGDGRPKLGQPTSSPESAEWVRYHILAFQDCRLVWQSLQMPSS